MICAFCEASSISALIDTSGDRPRIIMSSRGGFLILIPFESRESISCKLSLKYARGSARAVDAKRAKKRVVLMEVEANMLCDL